MRVSRAPRVVGRSVEGRMVLVGPPPTLASRVLNEVGARVWELADDRPVASIAAILAEEFAVDEDRVREDVEAFVAELIAVGMLRGAGP